MRSAGNKNSLISKAVVVFLLAIVIGGGLLWRRFFTEVRQERSLQKVVIGIQDNSFPALVFIAKELRFFESVGLDVELKRYPGGKRALEGLFQGQVDLATVGGVPITVASLQRQDFRIVSTIGYTDRGNWILARKDRGIKGPEDLKGKTIATQELSAAHFFLKTVLQFYGIPENSVTIRFLPPEEMPGALRKGQIDAMAMRNPYIALAKKQGEENYIELFFPNIYRQYFMLVAMIGYIEGNERTLTNLLMALKRAETVERSVAIDALVRQLGKERRSEVNAAWDNYEFLLSLSHSLVVTLENELSWIKEEVSREAVGDPNFLDFIYLNALEKVKPAAITIRK